MNDAQLAERVRDVWSSALGHGGAADGDNFFLTGGHSMLGIRMMAALGSALGTRLPIRLLFDHPTLGELTAAVTAALATPAAQGSE